MELYQLRYFYCAAKYANISEASRRLMVAQSSVSKAIANLESELQVPLFDRTGKKVTLNKNGELLLSKTIPVLSALDALPELFLEKKPQSLIRLRVLSSSALIPDILMKFRVLEPDICFQLLQSKHSEPADLTILAEAGDTKPRSAVLLIREEIQLAVPVSSPLRLRKDVSLDQLEAESMVMLSKGRQLRDQLEHLFLQHGKKLHVNFESDNPFLVRMLVQSGLGVTLWPSKTWSAYETDRITFLPIRDPQIFRSVYMVHNPEREMTPEIRRFMQYLQEYLSSL